MIARRSHARGLATLVVLAVLALLAGCGGQASGPGTTGAATGSTTGAGVPPGATTVNMKNTAFVPADLTIKVGQTVAWVNQDSTQHDVVANDGSFKSPLLDTNQVFTFTFTKAGSFPYYCAVHPQMQGTVTVQP